ncbi:MAG TPA: glycosyltransferase family 9 protein, partial [Chloroflexota bacterium]
LDRLGVRRPTILHPGAGAAWKRWPVERYAELAAQLRRRGHDVLLVEGPADENVVAQVQRDMAAPLPTLPRMGARALAAVLTQARLVVGNDSGVTHLASATGSPTIALFGSTDPASWRPLGRPRILRRCTKTASGDSAVRLCDDPACMAALTVEEVLEAAEELDVQNRVETRR